MMELLIKGTTLARIKREVMAEQMASAMYQSKSIIRIEEVMTPTLPRRSAKMCKKTPYRFSL